MADRGKEIIDVVDENDDEILPPQTKEGELYTLPILQLIKDAQQTHGLRHGDYQRYRQYCARRIHRIRKSLHFPQGTKHKVTPKQITEKHLKDVRYLYLPLFDAERAWGYSMQLKAESNTELRKGYHTISRLRKAVQHAKLLASLCDSEKCDSRTKLEAQAYSAWMSASLHFAQKNWQSSHELYTTANVIYEKLAGAFVGEMKDLYQQRVDEIKPNLRYCSYNIGDDTAKEDLLEMRRTATDDGMSADIDALIEKTRKHAAENLSEVTWRGRTVPVTCKQVRVFLLSYTDTEEELKSAADTTHKLSILESLSKELIDAQQALREANKEDPTFKAMIRGNDYEGKVPNNVYLHSYLTYLRNMTTVQRYQCMIDSMKGGSMAAPGGEANVNKGGKTPKPQDLARLYESIIQLLTDIPTLPGLEDDAPLQKETEVDIKAYKAFRCYYMAQTYVYAKKYREGLALYERTLTYAKQAAQDYKNIRGKNKEKEQLEELVHVVEAEKFNCHATSILDDTEEDVTQKIGALSVKEKKLLADRLEVYYEDSALTNKKAPQLCEFPPSFEAVPCKPLFFDLALSLVEFPDLTDKVQQQRKGGGITGMVSGWLWGGGKK